jgi:phosphoribosylaminoimidazole-succinocarboxamide synthase
MADLVPNHVVSEDVPPEWKGRAIRCRQLEMVPVECIARGYLAGLGLESYRATGSISGVQFPPGLVEADRLPEPVFTPTTKAEVGHDEFMTMAEVGDLVGQETADDLERLTLAIYTRGAEIARECGVIIADTKFEFGRDAAGTLILADEVLTPDSSRFWKVAEYQPGRPQWSYDKQYLRDWSSSLGDWDRTYPGPPVPAEVVAETRARYVEIFEQLTGEKWST